MTDRWIDRPWPGSRLRSFLGPSVELKLRAEGRCRLCERPAALRKLTKHRLVPGRNRGRYEACNVVPLCWRCHQAVESSAEVRRLLRPLLWPVEIAHATRTPWLRERFELDYPRGAALALQARRDLVEKLAS